MRKIINTFKRGGYIDNIDVSYSEVVNYLQSVVSISTQDDHLLNLLFGKYPMLFDNKFLEKYGNISVIFREKCLKRLIFEQLSSNIKIMTDNPLRKHADYFVLTYQVLVEKFDQAFMKQFIKTMKFSEYAYWFLNNTPNPAESCINTLLLMEYEGAELNQNALRACYSMDQCHRRNFYLELLKKYNIRITRETGGQIGMLIGNKNIMAIFHADDTIEIQKEEPKKYESKPTPAWCKNLGHALIEHVDFQIGGSKIDRQYGDWLNIWNEITPKS